MRNTEEIWRLVDARKAAFEELSDRVWGMRQGARDYVLKPVDPKELLAKIKSVA